MTNLVQFSKEAFSFNGGSFNLNTGLVNPNKGYMVSTLGNEVKLHINPILKNPIQLNELTKAIFNYIGNTFDKWYNAENIYLGVWYNKKDGFWYLDLSENIASLSEAIILGKERKQLAIWDCKDSNEIKL